MPRAKNTSQAAYVCRFKGGQFAIDSDEGVNVKDWGPERTHDYKATNLEFQRVARAKQGKFTATVKPASTPSSYMAGKKVAEIVPATVGGGHTRKHQG